jgi:hypothetical protein
MRGPSAVSINPAKSVPARRSGAVRPEESRHLVGEGPARPLLASSQGETVILPCLSVGAGHRPRRSDPWPGTPRRLLPEHGERSPVAQSVFLEVTTVHGPKLTLTSVQDNAERLRGRGVRGSYLLEGNPEITQDRRVACAYCRGARGRPRGRIRSQPSTPSERPRRVPGPCTPSIRLDQPSIGGGADLRGRSRLLARAHPS